MTAAEDGLLAAATEYQKAAADLRERIRDARLVIQELRDVQREAADQVAKVRPEVERQVNEKVTAVVKAHLDALQKELKPFQAQVLKKIDEHWKGYTDILLGRARQTRKPGQMPIDDIARLIAQEHGHGLPSVIGDVPAAFERPPHHREVKPS